MSWRGRPQHTNSAIRLHPGQAQCPGGGDRVSAIARATLRLPQPGRAVNAAAD